MKLDPVCGSEVRQRGNRQIAEYAGQRYYFCSPDCLQRFDAQPDLFTAAPGEGNVANRDRGVHSIPMPAKVATAELGNTESDAGPG
ncbi:MAG TPA: YHS domain-containing protein [Chloroflexota bacterium]|nr:YHS domain-containing protein [Chloroflexota bacterium]